MSAPADRMMTDEAVEVIRTTAGAVLIAAADTSVPASVYQLALGVAALAIDREARLEVEAATVKELNAMVSEAARQIQNIILAASMPGVTH